MTPEETTNVGLAIIKAYLNALRPVLPCCSKSVHTRLVRSGGCFGVFFGGDVLDCRGDRRLIVEV